MSIDQKFISHSSINTLPNFILDKYEKIGYAQLYNKYIIIFLLFRVTESKGSMKSRQPPLAEGANLSE